MSVVGIFIVGNSSVISLKEQIESVQIACEAAISQARTLEELEQARVAFLGRNGQVADLTALLKEAPIEEKRACGSLLNQLKNGLEDGYKKHKKTLEEQLENMSLKRQRLFDVTAYTYELQKGSRHIYTQLIERLEDIFISMGYEIATGPEVETEYHNFSALNVPEHHPARDMQDTFWMHIPHMLLRTQTSPVQIRSLESKGVPIALFAPGRVYRNEQVDASHDFMFTQGEGLVVDKDISLSHLLGSVHNFLRVIFEKDDLNMRVRPGYFPFVEPGLEVDISCPFCSSGCSVCKKTGWIELMGSGLVHPHVLRTCGIDPEVYSGFAFGFGIERMAMIKHGIRDIRLFHAGKTDFLKQF